MPNDKSCTVSVVSFLLLQRIIGWEINPGLRFFGQAIDGIIDMEEDELPDIVIGSQGTVVVLRYGYCLHYVYGVVCTIVNPWPLETGH